LHGLTRPTGEEKGLGLSLGYDIITKELGGTIRAETIETEFAEFIIQLPVNAN
jgi:signal transduction histidine kinase